MAYISEPVFAGEFNQVLRIFHDEQKVREAAFSTVQKMVNEGFFSLVEETFFNVPVRYENFAEFENHTINATHSQHRLDEKLYALVKRRFDPSVLRRIAVIKSAQRLGISLEAISAAMSKLPRDKAPSTSDWKKMSTRWRAELQKRITRLERLRDELDGCIGCGCLSLKACQLGNPEDEAGDTGSGAVFLKRNKSIP